MSEQALEPGSTRGRSQFKTGIVVSNKMDKTVIVSVKNTVIHSLYQRYMKKTVKFSVHDENNECNIGDKVSIVSSRPLSKTKKWRVRKVLQRVE